MPLNERHSHWDGKNCRNCSLPTGTIFNSKKELITSHFLRCLPPFTKISKPISYWNLLMVYEKVPGGLMQMVNRCNNVRNANDIICPLSPDHFDKETFSFSWRQRNWEKCVEMVLLEKVYHVEECFLVEPELQHCEGFNEKA